MQSFESGPAGPASNKPGGSVRDSEMQPYVLVGPLGLRAGWGTLMYLVLAAILGYALFFAVAGGTGKLEQIQTEAAEAQAAAQGSRATRETPAPELQKLSTVAISELSYAGAVLLAALGLSYLEQRRFAVYGLPRHRLRDIVPGALWGLVAIAVLVGVLRGLHLLTFDHELLHGGAIVEYGLLWLAVFLFVGIFEEFLFRGYIQFTLMRGLLGLARRIAPARERFVAFWMSALVWSGMFFFAHKMGNSGENPAGLTGVFLAGILFSYALWRTGSLWWGIGFHMTWDWAQSFLFGVPDSGTLSQYRLFSTHPSGNPLLSGGVDGPEGSLLLIPVMLMAFVVLRFSRPAVQPPVEPESWTQELRTPIA